MTITSSHWSANAAVLAVVALVAAVHLRGTLAITRGAGPGGTYAGLRREAVFFDAGLLAVLLALVSPVGYWSHRYIWVRSVQDLLLANVAPALIVLGAPWLALARGLGVAGRTPPAARAGGDDAARPVRDWPPLPVLAVIGFNVVWCGWHIPALYDAALRFPAVYAAEIVSYLGFGVVLWLQLIGSQPLRPALTPLRRAILLMGTITVGTVLGMVLVFGSGLAYPAYAGTGHHVLSVVYDQQTGGAVLWVLMLPAYTIAGIALLIRWLNDEETGAMTSGLDRLLKPAKPAWPSRPGLR